MKKLNFKNAVLAVFLLMLASSVFAQDNDSPFSVNCDLMSRYVWRGTDFGGSPSIQPAIEFGTGGLVIGAWGAFTTNMPGAQEADLYLGYTYNDIVSVTVTDYFFPDDTIAVGNYFDYGENTTGHVFEVSASFNGTDKIPVSLLVGMNVFGADAKRLTADGAIDGNQYSTYAELAYTYKNISLFAGANLTKADTDLGEAGFYGDEIGFVNVGCSASKEIAITEKFSLPLTVSLITNPQKEKIYFVAGFSF